jgi:hypothetical protein
MSQYKFYIYILVLVYSPFNHLSVGRQISQNQVGFDKNELDSQVSNAECQPKLKGLGVCAVHQRVYTISDIFFEF